MKKVNKKRFYIDSVFKILAVLLIGAGIYEIPHNIPYKINVMIEKLVAKASDLHLFNTVLPITLGIIFFSLVKIFFYVKAMKRYQVLYILSFVCIVICCLLFIWKNDTITLQLIFLSLLVSSYYLYKRGMKCKIKELKSTNNNSDESIYSSSEDVLGRINTAERIAEMLEKHQDESLKIGVYGRWGSGKTSLMNLVKESLQKKENFIVCWFNPWTYHSDKDLWIGFREAIEQELIMHDKGVLNFPIFRSIKAFSLKIFQHSTSKLPIGKLIDELIKNAGTPIENEIKASINNYLNINLPQDAKIIVFIDDLDRLDDAKRILTILKTVKEIINIDKISYVLAIDDETVSKIITKEMNLTSGNLFLEKIINYHITIDEPSVEGRMDLLQKELNKPKNQIDTKVINNIKSYLPNNPRTLKRYLQNMNLLATILQRFESDEINLNFIYLVQILNLEFPNVYKGILRDSEVRGMFSPSYISKKKASLITADDAKEILNKYPVESKDMKRAKNIIMGLQIQINKLDKNFDLYFRIIESSSVLTWKEYKSNYERLRLDNTKFDDLIKGNLKSQYIEHIFNHRDELFGKIHVTKYHVTAKNYQQELVDLDNHIQELIPLVKPEYQVQIFNLLYKQLKGWINTNMNGYEEFYRYIHINNRNREKKIIKDLTEILAGSYNEKLLEIINPWYPDEKMSPQFYDYKRDLLKIIEPFYIQNLLDKFSLKNGLNIWSDKDFALEKYYLFRDSRFHKSDIYNKLDNLAEMAKEDLVIRENFLTYMYLCNHHLNVDASYIHAEKVREVLKNEEFVKILWKGVTSEEVSVYSFSILKDFSDFITTLYEKDIEEIIVYPDWWEDRMVQCQSI
ncbi:KAP family P-loop NTPase fold protein [Bacillus thuringiensis]|uniref:KAP family P-loop NTPase fold protein n=1 Tax=Bacillus thuringiensis TaxID=1428 RepID=UPI00234F289D|nr:P-loop NTPase fold protein [Bacillus thuringiensis]MDC7735515.1 P-loop NTPase fold protein [Bacillus thuringiensis]HDR8197986.1 AAA family ATPase [Bacillus thuringiensis]